MSTTRTKTLSVLLITSLMALTAMPARPLLAAPLHQVCDRTDHGCARIDLDSCCCGNPADTSPSQVPSDRSDTVSSPPVAVAAVPTVAPPAAAVFAHNGPALARPPDLWIRFADFRI